MRSAIKHLKKSDPILADIIRNVGPFTLEYREPSFETLVRSIVYQQLSGRVASVILGRLIAMLPDGQVTPAAILKLTPARRTNKGHIKFETLADLPDLAVIEHLTQVKGIGVWTAHMFLIFALRRPDVLATGDLGVRMAVRKAYQLEELPLPKEMEELAVAWRPYSSVAVWYLWRSLDSTAQI